MRLVLLLLICAVMPSAAAAQNCPDLASLVLPGGGFGGASPFAALPAFCRVSATLRPSPRSEIGMEVWLPAGGWNGKLQVVGNGGFAGTIGYPALASALAGGYAAAGTDTGHTGPSSNTFADEDTLIDFAHRAVHETTVATKTMVDAFFGTGPRLSYFNGCSTGGRQALTAAQRYTGSGSTDEERNFVCR